MLNWLTENWTQLASGGGGVVGTVIIQYVYSFISNKLAIIENALAVAAKATPAPAAAPVAPKLS